MTLTCHIIQQVLDSDEPNGHTQFWPPPPKAHWNNWICTSMQNISSFDLFILEVQSFQRPMTRLAKPIFDHTRPQIFWSTFNLCELVSTCKNQVISLFWRYGWLKNPAIWLAENILGHLSGKKNFPNMGFVQDCSKYEFSLSNKFCKN